MSADRSCSSSSSRSTSPRRKRIKTEPPNASLSSPQSVTAAVSLLTTNGGGAARRRLPLEDAAAADATGDIMSDDDDEVRVVNAPVVQHVAVLVTPVKRNKSAAAGLQEDDSIQVVGTRNAMPLPHMRPHCTNHTFVDMKDGVLTQADTSSNKMSCEQCYCYVCDVLVKDCLAWARHCNAVDNKGASGYDWQMQRQEHRRTKTVGLKLFEARPTDADMFKGPFNLFADQWWPTDQVVLEIQPSGLHMYATASDSKNVSSADLFFTSATFSLYQCDKPVRLTVLIEDLNRAFQSIHSQSDRVLFTATATSLTVQVRNYHNACNLRVNVVRTV